jgi:UDP-3-O-[3-hydroxymyristoyl] glucosamine N-acyltransferase
VNEANQPHTDVSGGGVAGRHSLTARRIAELVKGELRGNPDVIADNVAPLDRAGATSITFLGSAKYAGELAPSAAAVLLVTPELADTPGAVPARILVANPQESMLALLPLLYPEPHPAPGIDPTVRIGRGARIGREVAIGPGVVIGTGAVIGDRVRIDANCVIGDGVEIGDDARLFPHVTLYRGASLGRRVIVHAGARLASDGFGYVQAGGAHQKIPHVGRCVIEDDVEIGANTTIDRGSLGDTIVGRGTKIDNLVQIGHNVRIGKLCLIMAQVGIAGSVRVGDGVVLAGQAGISGHHTIGDGARIAAQAGVFGDIPAGETWSGYPARPHREALRAHAAVFKLPNMIKALEKLIVDKS